MKRSSPSSTSPTASVPPKKSRPSQPVPYQPLMNTGNVQVLGYHGYTDAHHHHHHYANTTPTTTTPQQPIHNAGQQVTPHYYPATPMHSVNRTIFFGSVGPTITLESILDLITTGPIEFARLVPEKSCAFVTFISAQDASAFISSYPTFTVGVGQSVLTLNWGKRDQEVLPIHIQTAVNAGASRNVYIAGVLPSTSLPEIYADVEMYGTIDQIRIIPPRENHTNAIAFIHFASIHSAINCVHNLMVTNPKYAGRRISYGKDRCAANGINSNMVSSDKVHSNPHRFQHHVNHGYPQHHGINNNAGHVPFNFHYPASIARTGTMSDHGYPTPVHQVHPPIAISGIWTEDPTFAVSGNLAYLPAEIHARDNPQNLRVLYFGNLPGDAIPEDICNVVRAGLIDRVHMTVREDGKRIIFVSFIDPRATSLMYYMAQTYGVVIRSRRIRVHWGKHTAGVHPTIASAVLTSNATRCVYVGGLAPVCRNLITSTDPNSNDQLVTEPDSVTTPPNSATGTPSHLLPVLAEQLRQVLGEYGDIEVIYAPVDKPIAFVHFMELRSAIKAVAEASTVLRAQFQVQNLRVGYARDRCADPIKVPQPNVSIGGAIPRRGTGSFALVDLAGANSRTSDAVEDSALQPPSNAVEMGDAADIVEGERTPSVVDHLSDEHEGDDDPAAGVREEMLEDACV